MAQRHSEFTNISSPVFRAILNSDMKGARAREGEIIIMNMNSDTLISIIYHHIYTAFCVGMVDGSEELDILDLAKSTL